MAPPPSGEDKALNRPATASTTEGPGLEPGKAVDGDASTRWSSNYIEGQWWQVDLGRSRRVNSVRINWEAAYARTDRISTSGNGNQFSTVTTVTLTQAGTQHHDIATRNTFCARDRAHAGHSARLLLLGRERLRTS